MGTQQILLIVLSVIIVGIAVAVGITMFNQQTLNSARQAIIGDMNNMAATAQAWYKTPVSMGGAGYTIGDVGAAATALETYIGGDMLDNDNAAYDVTILGTVVTIESDPKEASLDATNPILKINLASGNIAVTSTGVAPADPA
jgi:hypothetical protein